MRQEYTAKEQVCLLCLGQHPSMGMKYLKRKQALKNKGARVNVNSLKLNQLLSYVANNNHIHSQLGLLENQLTVAAITAIVLSEEQRTEGTYQEVIRTLDNSLPTSAVMNKAKTTLSDLSQTLKALMPNFKTEVEHTIILLHPCGKIDQGCHLPNERI